MSIDPQPIKITLNTNIPGKIEFPFTSDLLYNPDPDVTLNTDSKYPYMIDDALLPDISGLDYAKIIKIFFNIDEFRNEFNPTTNNNIVFGDDTKSIIEKNINMMLTAIFPTKPLAIKYNQQSIDQLLEKTPQTSMFYNPVKTRFSYLKIDNKPYTVVKSVWLNDIVNHPKYKLLLKDVHNTIISNNTTLQDILQKIKVEIRKLINICNKIKIIMGKNKINDRYSVNDWQVLIIVFFIETYITDLTKNKQDIFDKIKKNTNKQVIIGDNAINVYSGTNIDDRINEVKQDLSTITTEDNNDIVKRFEQIKKILGKSDIKKYINISNNNELTNILTVDSDDELTNTLTVDSDKNLSSINWSLIEDYNGSSKNVITQTAIDQINNGLLIPQFKTETFDSRTSSNSLLQDILDKDIDIAISNLNDIYNRFVLNNKDQSYNEYIISLGVDRINANKRNNEPKREIFVFLDLVDGEINNSNKKQVMRYYKGEFLGNLLTRLLKSNKIKHIVEHFPIYSIETKKSTKFKNEKQNNVMKNTNRILNDNRSDEPSDELIRRFDNLIMNNKEIPKIINDLRDSSNKINQTFSVNIRNLLPFIRDSKDIISTGSFQINLYKLIQKWGSINNRDTRSLDEMKRQINNELQQVQQTINTRLDQNNKELQIVDKINLQNKINMINHTNNYLKLYTEIVNELIQNIATPTALAGGKSKNTRRKTKVNACKNKTCKNNYNKKY